MTNLTFEPNDNPQSFLVALINFIMTIIAFFKKSDDPTDGVDIND